MKTQLLKLLEKLDSYRERADELSNSENEATAERYTAVYDSLNEAYDAIESAIGEFDQ